MFVSHLNDGTLLTMLRTSILIHKKNDLRDQALVYRAVDVILYRYPHSRKYVQAGNERQKI